jgi:hypothetical protein
VTTVAAATSANTASTLVRRDANGDFAGRYLSAGAAMLRRTNAGLFYGQNAGNTTGTGITNVGIGDGTLLSLTSGDDNTALGSSTLVTLSSGTENVAIGQGSLFSLSNGNYNIGIGTSVLNNLTSGHSNTAIGRFAMAAASTAYSNVAVGRNALVGVTNSFHNVAVGDEAGKGISTGITNTAIGYQALQNVNGDLNTAIGANALDQLTSGDYNTALGTSAAGNLTSGINNVAIGYLSANTLTSGNGNIYIGADAGAATESGHIRIGGSQSSTYIQGISGATIGTGVAVYVNSAGRLGTITSSARYKDRVTPITNATDTLMRLRPVTFHYKPELNGGADDLQFGLIAEEVAEVDPSLVLFGEDGQVQTVRYHFLTPLLLAEMQEQRSTIEEQKALLAAQQQLLNDLLTRIERIESAKRDR